MKTKDLIKLLQEEDPSGETHVRIQGGAISHCEGKPGYWDGPYSYFDENGVYVMSTKDYKIDIITRDVDDVIWDLVETDTELKEKIRVEYDYCDKTREENVWKHVEEEAQSAKEFNDKLQKEYCERVLKKAKEGWKVRHSKDGEEKKYYRKWKWTKGVKRESVVFGEIKAITESGLFHPVEKRKYIYYELVEHR